MPRRSKLNPEDVLRLLKEGLNDHEIGEKLGATHDSVRRARLKLQEQGLWQPMLRAKRSRSKPIRSILDLGEERIIDGIIRLTQEARRAAILEKENAELRREIGALHEQLGRTEKKLEDVTRRYHLLKLEMQQARAEQSLVDR